MTVEEVREAAIDYSREIAEFLFPDGQMIGDSWCIGDITREPGKSLKIHLPSGLWRDWAEDDRSQDLLALWQEVRGVGFPVALKEVEQFCASDSGISDRSHIESQTEIKQRRAAVSFKWECETDDYLARAHAVGLMRWRGYRERFCAWLIANNYIGWRTKFAAEIIGWALPRCDEGGKIESMHYIERSKPERICAFYPSGAPSRSYRIGDPKIATDIIISESPWDVLAAGDLLGIENEDPLQTCLLATFGAVNWKLINSASINPKAEVYVLIQNDEPGRKWAEKLTEHLKRDVYHVVPPSQFPDLNDWLKAGISADALESAIKPITFKESEAEPAANGSEPSANGNQDPDLISERIKYVLDGRNWWALNEQREWIPLGGTDAVRRNLRRSGLNPRPLKGQNISEVDATIHQIEMNHYADISGRYAGYLKAGVYQVAGSKLLVPRSHRLPTVKEGGCGTLLNFLQGMFTARDQLEAFYGWLQTAVRTLREDKPGEWSPGQALVLLGGTGVGKTALQGIIDLLLTERAADPTKYYIGDTPFNSDLGEAEHWKISDPTWSDYRQKQKFAKSFKNDVANTVCALHPKGRQQIHLPIFKRISISLNEDEESLSVLPLMDPSYLEKLLLLNCFASEHTPNAKIWKHWIKQVKAEVPAFLYFLLHRFQIPDHLIDGRYGVRYKNAPLENRMSTASQEEKDEVVDDIILRTVLATRTEYSGTSSQIHSLIFGNRSRLRETAHASNLPKSPAVLGKMLHQWIIDNGGRRKGYTVSRRLLDGYHLYSLTRTVTKVN